MLRKYIGFVLRSPDVNTDAASSTASEGASSTSTQQASTAATTTAQIASTQKTEKTETLKSVLADAFEKATETSSEKNADGSIKLFNSTKKEGDNEESTASEKKDEDKTEDVKSEEEIEKGKEEGKQDEEKSADDEATEDKDQKPVPYTRFKEVITEKNDLAQKVKEYEPVVNDHRSVVDFCQKNGVSPEQYQQGVQFLALLNNDPVAALQQLEPLVQQLKGLSGDIMPADLKADIESGVLSEARAKEIAKLRAQSTLKETKSRQTAEQQRQEQVQNHVRGLHQTLSIWDTTTRKADPDFKPKGSPDAANGKYEYWLNALSAEIQSNPPKSGDDLVRMAVKHKSIIDKDFKRFQPSTKSRTVASSTQSSTGKQAPPKDLKTAVAQAAAAHGIGV